METANFLGDLDRMATLRQTLAHHLNRMAMVLDQAETKGETASGQLGLAREIETVQTTRQTLEQGVFRLLVLGDLKRGKSTLLNALLGERLLPSDVAPCTALLTIVKYGPQRQVTVYFKDNQAPEVIDFTTFKTRYTIDLEETKALEAKGESAFPNVSHAVVEYPLPLLQKGVEIIDTPGLNDTEARNRQVLEFANTCHAVLFVLDATQPMTLDEQRYLQNYLRDRGLELFFLINGWDRLQMGVVNPDDTAELQAAQDRQRSVFRSALMPYVGQQYGQRVFETSALEALRLRLKDSQAPLTGTGIAEVLAALSQYLGQERAKTELQRVHHVVQRTYDRVQEVVERRIPLLAEDAGGLKQRIESVQENFEALAQIRDDFCKLITKTKDEQSQAIANSFRDYLLKLELTFEQDFVGSQPDLEFIDFLQKKKRQEFYNAFKRAFERYMNDRLAGWEFMAKQDLAKAFTQLNDQSKVYAEAYADVIGVMNGKILGDRFSAAEQRFKEDEAKIWADAIAELFEAIPDNLNQSVTQFNQFWQTVLLYACIYAAIQIALILVSVLFSALALNILAGLALGVGAVAVQAETVRQTFLSTTKQEFVKALPQIAEDQRPVIYRAVQRCFEEYEAQVIERINTDIAIRRAELNNLLKQKETHKINQVQEAERLWQLQQEVGAVVEEVAEELAALQKW